MSKTPRVHPYSSSLRDTWYKLFGNRLWNRYTNKLLFTTIVSLKMAVYPAETENRKQKTGAAMHTANSSSFQT